MAAAVVMPDSYMPDSDMEDAGHEVTSSLFERAVAGSMLAAIVFINGADFRGNLGDDFQVHWQIYLRLVLTGLAGLFGFLNIFPRTLNIFFTLPGLLLTGWITWYGCTLPLSIHTSYSTAAWVSLLCVVLFVPSAMRILGGSGTLKSIGFGLTIFLVGSWIAYLVFPEIGVFNEQVTQTESFSRMGGLGHPNELGFYSAYTIIVFVVLGVRRRLSWLIVWPILVLGGLTLLTCYSRTAMLVCAAGLPFAVQPQLRSRGNFFSLLGLVGIVLVVSFILIGIGNLDWMIEDILLRLTKSGSSRELSTASGRTEIWDYALQLIAEKPLFGHGYATARFVMEDYSYHAHNIVLNAALYGGLPSGLLVVLMCVYLVAKIVTQPSPEIDGWVICLLVGGMVDGLISAASPAASTTIWLVVLFWHQLDLKFETRSPFMYEQWIASDPT